MRGGKVEPIVPDMARFCQWLRSSGGLVGEQKSLGYSPDFEYDTKGTPSGTTAAVKLCHHPIQTPESLIMYLDYFGFKSEPFSISPDPRFLFMSERHREALAHLLYGMKSEGGFVLLTGDIGTGKTTICRCLLEQLPEDSEVALLLNPKLTAAELLANICDELRIPYPQGTTSIKLLVDAINGFLLDVHAQGRRTVVIIDEAQNLDVEVLEQIRLLTNLETNTCKLLQIIMLGQPELKEMLERPELRQLSQRITARYHLAPLSQPEVGDYIRHRMAVAGVDRPIFPPASLRRIYRLTGGVPRLINVLCDRALLGAYVKGENRVRPALLAQAAEEVLGGYTQVGGRSRSALPLKLLLALALVGGGVVLGAGLFRQPPPVAPASTSSAPVENASASAEERTPPPVSEEPSGRWLDVLAREESNSPALHALFAAWKLTLPVGEVADPAALARENGLAFLSLRGSLTDLLTLNRPVLLKLTGSRGENFQAALTALDEQTATLRAGAQEYPVPVEDLVRHWFGEYELLWQPPPGYRRALMPGDQGVTVEWLARRFDILQQRPDSPVAGRVYDEALYREVREFQAGEGLDADGLVGPLTLIRLNNRTGGDQPRLNETPKG